MERLQATAGDDFDWTAYFDDVDAREILIEILASLARNFSNFDRRKRWFIDLLNKERQAHPGSNGRAFSEVHFQMMACALFEHLRMAIEDSDTRRSMAKKFGRQVIAEIEIFLDNIS